MSEGETTTLSLKPFEAARLALARLGLRPTEEIERSLASLTQICSDSMQVARVGVWFFDGENLLRNAYLYDGRTRQASYGALFPLQNCPAYHDAIRTRRAVAVHDAQNDPKTSEMRDSYLIPHGITSMLDAPIYVDGEIIGIVCHEHVGPMRVWSQADFDFATSVADVLSSLCQQSRRMMVEEENRQMQDRLVRAEQMHSLARLAAGVAHDINNLLSVVLLNASGLPASPQAQMIEEQCQIGARLARQLFAFARESPPEQQELDLREVIRGVESLLSSALGPQRQLKLDLGSEPLVVLANRSEIEQVLLNLTVNARDAMADGDSLTLQAAQGDTGVTLEVHDTGAGMTPEVCRRAFEPFFTTRRNHGGSGMGLAVVYGAMRRARGSVEVTSEPGHGTTFSLRWPRVAPPSLTPAEARSPA